MPLQIVTVMWRLVTESEKNSIHWSHSKIEMCILSLL